MLLTHNGQTFDSSILAAKYGIVIPHLEGLLPERARESDGYGWAQDSQPSLVTTSNAGIPSYLANYLDPKIIEVLVAPMKAAEITGEHKVGDWTTNTAQFPVVESTGETSGYGDFNENGSVNMNANWPSRQSFMYQTFTQWGERELDMMGLGRIDYAARLNIASALTLNKFQNKSYFFGIANIANYGLLNDPNLPAPISPAAGVWSGLDGQGVFNDIQRLYKQLVSQGRGYVTRETAMTLALSPEMEANFTKTNTFNVNVSDQIKKNFPNMRVVTAVEYNTGSGQLAQLIADDIEGQKTAECCFNEKMRAHNIEVRTSSYRQKKSGGTWGAIIYRPFLIAGLLGV